METEVVTGRQTSEELANSLDADLEHKVFSRIDHK
jgi:hypothetical protein